MKHAYRSALALALVVMCYIAFQPSYDFTRWVPIHALRLLCLPEIWIDGVLKYADKFAHAFATLILSSLYFLSVEDKSFRLLGIKVDGINFIFLLFLLSLFAEIVQVWIGRNFSLGDILASVIGGLITMFAFYCKSRIANNHLS